MGGAADAAVMDNAEDALQASRRTLCAPSDSVEAPAAP